MANKTTSIGMSKLLANASKMEKEIKETENVATTIAVESEQTQEKQQGTTEVAKPEENLLSEKKDKGLPEELLYANPDSCVRIPMRSELRSLNLSNSAAIAVYEVLRQWDYPDMQETGELRSFDWADAETERE